MGEAQYDSERRFLGYWPNECGGTLAESHTGGKRAWCSQCSEWCYPQTPCRGCELPALRARLAEVEQALREAKEALDKTVPVLLTVKPNLDRPYPDALTLTPWTRWCEPLARRVDDARRSARAVLDKGKQTDG